MRILALGSVCCVESQDGSCALKSPRIKVCSNVFKYCKLGEYPWGVESVGGMYMLAMLSTCLCSCSLIVCISNVLSCGMFDLV